MGNITLPKAVVKKMLAAIECAQALDMPTQEGESVLEHHGWSREDRFDLPATKFTAKLLAEASSAAREYGA
jgi:hypothetical protein